MNGDGLCFWQIVCSAFQQTISPQRTPLIFGEQIQEEDGWDKQYRDEIVNETRLKLFLIRRCVLIFTKMAIIPTALNFVYPSKLTSSEREYQTFVWRFLGGVGSWNGTFSPRQDYGLGLFRKDGISNRRTVSEDDQRSPHCFPSIIYIIDELHSIGSLLSLRCPPQHYTDAGCASGGIMGCRVGDSRTAARVSV